MTKAIGWLFLGWWTALATMAQGEATVKIAAVPTAPAVESKAVGDNRVSWNASGHGLKLRVQLGRALEAQQLATLTSGFSTFSRFTVSAPQLAKGKILSTAACTVKYDLWEERYQVTTMRAEPISQWVKNFADYTLLCLTSELGDSAVLQRLQREGGLLRISLQVEQISTSQAEKVKSWLVNQQSTMMRGLFSHMLGELTLSQSSSIDLEVPPA